MTDFDAIKLALREARAVINSSPFDAHAAQQAIGQLSAFSPPHLAPLAAQAKQAVRGTMSVSSNYDTLAMYAMTRLVAAIERTLLRAVD